MSDLEQQLHASVALAHRGPKLSVVKSPTEIVIDNAIALLARPRTEAEIRRTLDVVYQLGKIDGVNAMVKGICAPKDSGSAA